MKILQHLEQGSDTWKAWRSHHITATCAATILGLNRWQTPLDLWKEMRGIISPPEENDAMRHGKLNEDIARQLFIERTSMQVVPIVIQSSEYPWMGASLDGYNEDNRFIVEIKCPVKLEKHLAVYEGIVDPMYVCQMQHQLACSNADCCYFVSYHKDDPELIAIRVITPNENFIAEMIEKERKFYECLCNDEEPEGPWKLNTREP